MVWSNSWRNEVWSSLDQPFDLIVIGGGITGGGIFLEAARAGIRTLLVEAHDFSSGTSSRSSKLVHGGFRYLKNAQFRITFDSVRERERLLQEGRGLINQIGFLIASYKGDRLPMWALGLGLTLYDLFAFKWGHKYYSVDGLLDLCPRLNSQNLVGGYRYFDALTDDARLVLRTIKEGVIRGGFALNYAEVKRIIRTKSGMVKGVILQDLSTGRFQRQAEVRSKAVINATGPWADQVSDDGNQFPRSYQKRILRIRRLRGSHIVFSTEKIPLTRAVSIWHPKDKRPVFTFPWEGVTLVGTTDVDYQEKIETNPCISQAEVEYLLEAVRFTFPSLKLGEEDIQSTFSGIRSVEDTGKKDPSKESREHMLFYDNGLLTIIGGKLTTFRLMAHQALNLLKRKIPEFRTGAKNFPIFTSPNLKQLIDTPLETREVIRLIGRYGMDAQPLIETAKPSEFSYIESSENLWAEIRWAARSEGIVHLDDLLLRRVRLAHLLPGGGLSVIERIKNILQDELSWNDQRWNEELGNYMQLLEKSYSVNTTIFRTHES